MHDTLQPSKVTSKKRGRKAEHYTTSWDEPINGLARRPSDGRWRIIGTNITFTEPDERLAVHRFRMWEAQQQPMKLAVLPVATGVASKDFPAAVAKSKEATKRKIHLIPTVTRTRDGGHVATYDITQTVPEQQVWAWCRQMILARPQYAAQQLGIEAIAWLPDLKRPAPSPTLDEVGQLYLDHAKVSPNWHAKSKQFWAEFVAAVQVEKLRDIEQGHIVDYGDMVREAAQSPAYARQRFGAIKAIINYPTKRGKWAEDAKRALSLCAVLVPPKKSATDPNPISPEDFRTLYRAADQEMKTILLLALNACMYGGEVAALDWSEVDLAKAVLTTHRNKTKIVRVAVLWPETVAALRQLPRRGEHLFLTDIGTQADYLSVYRLFKVCRKAAELETVQFSQIRDASYTAAVEAGTDLNLAKLLAGHATGISDHYLKRRPAMVASACEAIRAAYAIDKL